MSIQSEINRITTAVSDQESLIGEIVDALATRCVVSEPLLQARTVTPTEEVQVVTPDAGYDGLSSVTVEAAQGGEGTYGWKKSLSKLPSGYTEVEYLQGTGTQYIDTGFTPNQDTRVVVDFKIQGGTNEVLFGARTSSSADGICFYKRTTGYYASQYNDTISDTSVVNDTNRHIVDTNKNITYLDGKTVLAHTAGTFTAPNTMTLFASNDNGTVKYYANATIYSCQVYDNGTLVRDFIPCINASGVTGLYDAENGAFYTNAGTGTFFAGNPIRSDLPSGYTQIEYIQSSGTQYIDTGIALSATNIQGLRVVADIELVKTSGSWCVTGSGGAYPVVHFGINASGYFAYGKGDGDVATTTAYTQGRYLWDYDLANRKFTVGKLLSVTGISLNTSGTATRNFYISAYATTSGGVCHRQIIYSYKFYMNGALVRDFVPCKNASGAVGLYDLVNGVFYGNAGSGVFAAGSATKAPSSTITIGYVVSDDANAYPDGELLDGYYYEKL